MSVNLLDSLFSGGDGGEGDGSGNDSLLNGGAGGSEGGEGIGGGEAGAEGGEDGDGSPQTHKLLAQMIAENKRLADQNAELSTQFKKFAERDVTRPGTEAFLPGGGAQPQQTQIEQIKKAIGDKFITDPGGAFIDMLNILTQVSQKQAESMQLPLAQTQSQMVLDSFLASKRGEEYYDKVRSEFDAIVDRAITQRGVNLAKLAPQALKEGLEDAWEQAIGRAALKGGANRTNPPPYATGRGGGSANFSTAGRNAIDSLVATDPMEQEIIDSCRAYGLPDEDIKSTLKAYREENA